MSQIKRISVCLTVALVVTGLGGIAHAQEIGAPPHARDPASTQPPMPLPPATDLSGPMSDPFIGQQFMQVEVDPPATSRGAGGESMERLFAARCRSVVFIASQKPGANKQDISTGAGSIINIDGDVLTAAHVVEGAHDVVVGIFPNCKPGAQPELFPARVLRSDARTDLALLRLLKLPSDISVMPLGDIEEIRTGSNVVMIGHPQNLLMSMSLGLVSAVRPNFALPGGGDRRATVIQTDGALNPGNSGGPMMSSAGNLVGVNSFIICRASAGLNFAVSVADVRNFLAAPADSVAAAPAPAPAPAQAPSPSPQRAPETVVCKPKTVKEWREADACFTLLDMDCKGRANAVLMIPDDRNKSPYLALDRNGDTKIDVRFLLDAAGKPTTSVRG